MGAWNTTAFDNDDASDLLGELLESDTPAELLRETLALADDADYLAAPDGARIVAATAVIAAALGRTLEAFPDALRTWLPGKEASLLPLAPAAVAALNRVRAEDSEWNELWQESDQAGRWNQSLDAIASALTS